RKRGIHQRATAPSPHDTTNSPIASSECYISQLRVTGSNLSTRPSGANFFTPSGIHPISLAPSFVWSSRCSVARFFQGLLAPRSSPQLRHPYLRTNRRHWLSTPATIFFIISLTLRVSCGQ